MWHTNDGMGWWMIFMGVFWILFWASLIYLFVTAVARGRRGGRSDDGDAIEIAKRRLARGEITTDQFQEIRRHLQGDIRGPQPS
jgi:putative membrane protein